MFPRLSLIALSACALLLAACLPESKNPLSSPATSVVDLRLAGVYEQRDDKSKEGSHYWHFLYRGPVTIAGQAGRSPWLEMLGIDHDSKNGLSMNRYRALATHLGEHDYLSFVDLDRKTSAKSPPTYAFAQYEINWRGDLQIRLADTKAFAGAIRAGQLHGRVKTSQFGDNVMLTDTTEQLAAWVAARDPQTIFTARPLIFHRIAK